MNAEVVSIASDIAVGLSALIVAIVACLGLTTWRKELTGKAKFEVARNIMSLALKLNAKFGTARRRSISPTEYAGRSKQENESPDTSPLLDEWYARENRLKPLQEDLVKFQEASWEAEILLEKDASGKVSEAFGAYKQADADLYSAISSYFQTRHEETQKGTPSQDQNWLEELKKTMISHPGDRFSGQIEEATSKLKQALQPYVK